jgi:hypothetical protein
MMMIQMYLCLQRIGGCYLLIGNLYGRFINCLSWMREYLLSFGYRLLSASNALELFSVVCCVCILFTLWRILVRGLLPAGIG